MKKKNRMLAILLAFTMVLTFMPMLAFAEGEEADAEPQVTEATAEEADVEAVETEAVEEVAQKEAVEAVTEEAKPTNLTFTPASSFELEATEGNDWLSLDGEGNTFIVEFSDGSKKTFKSIEYTGYDEEDGEEYCAWGFFLDGDTKKEEGYFGCEINGVMTSEGGKFKAGDNKVRFAYEAGENTVFTREFTVKAEMKPIAIEFVPASGVTLWGFEGSNYIDGNAFFAEGNSFVVTYSDNKTKKTFTCVHVSLGNEGSYVGYFEDGIVTKKANGDYDDKNFEEDIPESGLKRGDNNVRFGIWTSEEVIWTKTLNVTGKPYAVSVTFSPNTFNGIIYSGYDDIDWYKEGNQVVVKYSDGTTKTFKPGETKSPEGYTYPAFKCGDEELWMGWPDMRLKEGKNTIPLTIWNLSSDEIICNVTVNATKAGVCTTHNLHKVNAIKATCQAPGIKAHYECSVCHKIFTDKKGKKETTYAKLATKKAKHVFKKKIVSDEYLKAPATCTKKATYFYACKTCDEKGNKTFTSGKPLGHDFVPGSITKATAKKDGKIASKCSRCGKTDKGTKIPKASKIVVLNKKSIVYAGEGAEKDAIDVVVKSSKYPLGADEYTVTKSEPTYNFKKKKGSGTITVTFTPECKYYSGSMTLTYKITKVPKAAN